jgi:hypothetical protein
MASRTSRLACQRLNGFQAKRMAIPAAIPQTPSVVPGMALAFNFLMMWFYEFLKILSEGDVEMPAWSAAEG